MHGGVRRFFFAGPSHFCFTAKESLHLPTSGSQVALLYVMVFFSKLPSVVARQYSPIALMDEVLWVLKGALMWAATAA
jgi:hypothetical protein